MKKKSTFLALISLLFGCATNEPKYQIGPDGTPMSQFEAEQLSKKTQPQAPAALQLDSPPRILKSKFPDYPQSFRDAGVVGQVTVQFDVEQDGTVSNPAIIGSPPPGLAALSLHAIMQWKFAPAMKNGVAVRVRAKQVFSFKVE